MQALLQAACSSSSEEVQTETGCKRVKISQQQQGALSSALFADGLEYFYNAKTGFVDLGDKRDAIRVGGEEANITSAHINFLLACRDLRARGFSPPLYKEVPTMKRTNKTNEIRSALYCAEEFPLLPPNVNSVVPSIHEDELLPTPIFYAVLGSSSNGSGTMTAHARKTTAASSTQNASDLPLWPESKEMCKCIRSHCLKRYCACFSQQQHCSSLCTCEQCENMLDRREGEWAIAVRKSLVAGRHHHSSSNGAQHQQAAANSVFCKCAGKTKCLKKYCECFANQVKCGARCLCVDCENC